MAGIRLIKQRDASPYIMTSCRGAHWVNELRMSGWRKGDVTGQNTTGDRGYRGVCDLISRLEISCFLCVLSVRSWCLWIERLLKFAWVFGDDWDVRCQENPGLFCLKSPRKSCHFLHFASKGSYLHDYQMSPSLRKQRQTRLFELMIRNYCVMDMCKISLFLSLSLSIYIFIPSSCTSRPLS